MAESEILIWAPDAAIDPEQWAIMRLFVDNGEWLVGVLAANGVTRAHVTPPLRQGTFNPAIESPDLQYEVIPAADISLEQWRAIYSAINDRWDLWGRLMPVFADVERGVVMKRNKLTILGMLRAAT